MEGIGAIVLIPLIVSLIYNEHTYLSFLLPSLFSLIIGYTFRKLFPGGR